MNESNKSYSAYLEATVDDGIEEEVFDNHHHQPSKEKVVKEVAFIDDNGGVQGKFTSFLKLSHHKTHKDSKDNGVAKHAMNGIHDSKPSAYVVEMAVVSQQSEKEQEAEYDPYKNRVANHPTSNSETLLHLLKGSLGTGILAMPNGFTHSGYVFGVIGTLVIGLICTYCIHLLVSTQYELCRRKKVPSLSYNGTAEASLKEGPAFFRAIAPYAAHIVNAFLLTYQLGTCCVYFVFISENVKNVMDAYIPAYNVRWYMLVFLVPLLLLNCIKNLKKLAPVSSFANFITVISYGIIVYYLFEQNPTLENREPFGKDISTYPLFFGTVLFALEAIGVMLPLENEMKHPKKFKTQCGILNIGMYTIILMYIGMGLLGYMAHGDNAMGTITLNLPKNDMLAESVLLLLALAIFLSYSLQFYVAIRIVWDEYIGPKYEDNPRKNLYEYVIRIFLVLLTFCLAAAFPKIDLFISLIGALCLSALGIGIPAIIELSAYWYSKSGTSFTIMFTKDLFLIIFSIIGLIIGTFISIENIAKEFLEPNP